MPNFVEKLKIAADDYNAALRDKFVEKDNKQSSFIQAYANFAKNSLTTAGLLFDITNDKTRRDAMKVDDSYNGNMWVIVSSYFSMFYMASALLAKKNLKVGRVDTHKHVKNAFLHVYIANHALDNALGIDYMESKEIAEDLMAERDKRSKYQYDVGAKALQTDAELSLKRARNFFDKARPMAK